MHSLFLICSLSGRVLQRTAPSNLNLFAFHLYIIDENPVLIRISLALESNTELIGAGDVDSIDYNMIPTTLVL